MRNRKFTLVEMLGTIVVLSIIVTSVSYWGDSNEFKKNQSNRDYKREQIVIQSEVTSYMYENKNKTPYIGGKSPTVFRAAMIDLSKLESQFTEKEYTYWMDSKNHVWKSKTTIPEIVGVDQSSVRWESTPSVDHYEIYEMKIDALEDADFLQMEPTATLPKTQTSYSTTSGVVAFVSAVDSEGYRTPPVASNDGAAPVSVGAYDEAKPVAKILISPDSSKRFSLGTSITITNDSPNKESLKEEEWLNKKEFYDIGFHRVGLRVKDQKDVWSDWVYETFEVE